MSARWNNSKGCPKCGSRSIYLDCDESDWYTHCLLCGHMVPVAPKDLMILVEREKILSPLIP